MKQVEDENQKLHRELESRTETLALKTEDFERSLMPVMDFTLANS